MTNTVVLDTGALTAFLVGSDGQAEQIRTEAASNRLAVPFGADLQVSGLLHTLVQQPGLLPEAEAIRALELLRVMQLDRHDTMPLTARTWSLRKFLSPYDAACAALAELLDAELLTTSPAFAAASLSCPIRDLRHPAGDRSLNVKRS
ncbi:PIN domain-containing protein [Streptomyces sp. MnatMP-M17]|uniref:PIN domain-containing protein n=1 Tax=unclassified Streptomyces TaxID=2593676 RepID=UPI00081DADEC|nr:PIN domain-containing protein [Streptomyces sp. MnatMP-M17]MYZ33737.1 PIN domain-containing protein [Streptomyces sp. SID4917]SCF61425.1 Predicted nucleic acid-binding protein, contains PIN domain [Streptomyces sp. MnatMP-M17]